MKKELILKKVIEKAVKNGFDEEYLRCPDLAEVFPNEIIFDHSFAKAFFGEEEVCADCGEPAEENYDEGICKNCCEGFTQMDNGPGDMNDEPAWQYHLQQLAISENRLEYLEKYLK